MIKANVLSTTMTAKPDAPIAVTMDMWVLDSGSLSCPQKVFIMKEEEYKAMDLVSDILRQSLLEEREETKELEEKNKYLKKRLMTRYTVKFDADGAIIYPELKED